MSSSDSSDEEMICFYYKRRMQRRRRFWVHPYIKNNINCRLFVAAKELQQTDTKFLALYRMSKESYLHLLATISPFIKTKNTKLRDCVSSEERILITLRYLGSGSSFVELSLYFARGVSTVAEIVTETTKLIWDVLKDVYMPIPNEDQWRSIAERFSSLWNIPNCVGAIDGKHVRIEKFPNSGSSNFNYKSFHSVILMACCDADGIFITIETGFAGRNSDGRIFAASALKYWIENQGLCIPSPAKLPVDESTNEFPFYFVGDEAFPLKKFLMRPYPRKILTNTKRVFNYRLSRARKTIECAFGMMTEKFQVLNTPIRVRNPQKVDNIVKAVCILHNYVRKREGIPYIPRELHERSNNDPRIIPTKDNLILSPNSSAYCLRDYLANYFLNPRACLPWQWNYCV